MSAEDRLAKMDGALRGRLEAAEAAVVSAGDGLMSLRGKRLEARQVGDQLKTAADAAAEGWVLGYLKSFFPHDVFLAEESFEVAGAAWEPCSHYWAVDALDGTRSFAEGFDGFCVQVAFIAGGRVRLGVVHEPVRGLTYSALEGEGAFCSVKNGTSTRLAITSDRIWPDRTVFVDSSRPHGSVAKLMEECRGDWLECGSIGLKICRVAEGSAHVFAKEFEFKIWDVAPGDLILREAGGMLGLWSGTPIFYGGGETHFRNLLAAPNGIFQLAASRLESIT